VLAAAGRKHGVIKMKSVREKGYALVFVLWVSALIAVVAAGLVTRVRTNALVVSNTGKSATTEAMADGVVRLLALRLSEGRQFQRNGVPDTCDYEGTRFEFIVQDQAGLIDLNTAPAFLLTELFARLGVNVAVSTQLTDAIIDFRDVDQVSQNGGTEAVIYEGRKFGPKNAPFETVEELDQIPGIGDELYYRMIALVTVNSFEAGIDPDAAPLEFRRLFEQSSRGDFIGMLAGFSSRSPKRVFGLDVRAASPNGGRFRRRAVVYLTGQVARPFSFLEWQRGTDWKDNIGQPAKSCFIL
jgi:type II secretory pathway component PulK